MSVISSKYMANTYLFFPSANKALDNIWNYSKDRYGTHQAKKYMSGLHNHLQQVCEKKKIWHPLPKEHLVPSDLNIQVYCSKYEHHFIYFRLFDSGNLGVMSILHESMDLPVRLCKDLQRIVQEQ